jgi:hypothetical protein
MILDIDIDIVDDREPYNQSEQQWIEEFPELWDSVVDKIDEWNEHLVWLKRKAATITRHSDIFPTALERWMFAELVKIKLDKATKNAKRNMRRLRLIVPAINATDVPLNPNIENQQIPFKNSITDGDIARAKDYPIEYLYVGNLRRTGRSQTGKCPIHQENTGSFHIYDDNSFHCFGCQAHGDAIDFVMRTREIPFVEAVRFINKLQA